MSDGKTAADWSFGLTLAGGVLILVGGILGAFMMSRGGTWGMNPMMEGWTRPRAWFITMALWMTFWSVLTGGAVLIAAAGLRTAPAEASTWGIVAVVAGALSFFAMGGFMIGGLAAITGGVLALTGSGDGHRAHAAD